MKEVSLRERLIGDSRRALKMNSVLYKRALDGLTPEELNRRGGERSNPMIWVAGHVLYSRCGLARYVGVETSQPWPDLFKRFSKVEPASSYPQLKEVLARWDANNSALKQRFDELTSEQLTGPGPWELPSKVDALSSGIAFLVWHESYHIGQMGYLRKWLGYDGLVG